MDFDYAFWEGSPSSEFSELDISPWSPMSMGSDQENTTDRSFGSSEIFASHGSSSPTSTTSSSPSSTSVSSPPAPSNGSGRRRNPLKRLQQRHAANQRERKRMKTINEAFEGLRTRIPVACEDRKLSKVDTLRFAIGYIQRLSEMVNAVQMPVDPYVAQGQGRDSKVIIRYNGVNDLTEDGFEQFFESPLYGHSLSWSNEKNKHLPVVRNNRLVATLWVPGYEDVSTLYDEPL